jgi:hypothetical protein
LLAAGAGFADFFLVAVLLPPGMRMGKMDVKLMLLLGLVRGRRSTLRRDLADPGTGISW